ncbi:MAG: hypothetical protein CMM61_12915 [Rhodospirillaceae bacterium]|nr:hypothetical protein [Rhodospirillaceae bacterium]
MEQRFIKISDQPKKLLRAGDVQAAFPHIMGVTAIPDADLAALDYARCAMDPAPAFDPETQVQEEPVIEQDPDDTWHFRTPVRAKTQAELDAEAAEEAAAAAAFITDALAKVDIDAEAARLQFITPGAGQALVYQRKEAQARACLAAHDEQNPPSTGDFPALDAEVGITAADILGVAAAVVAQAEAWAPIGDLIEATRLSAKAAIVAANGDQTAITAVLDGLSWPAPGA